MAQFDSTKSVTIDNIQIESTDVMTGDRNRNRFLYYQLKMSMLKAKQIDIIVSFLMESGVRMLLKDLKAALDRGVQVRILTGNYLGITQPSALCLIKKELGNRVDLRFYNEKARSFHPKSYIFHFENASEIYIGSSNISRSALTSGIEWNYRFSSLTDEKNYRLFYETFVDLFEHHSIIIDDAELNRYSKNWHKPAVAKDLAKYDSLEDTEDTKVEVLFQPRGAQIEALYALEDSRAEGATRGLVQAATGIGKTYLAAFDSAKYERILFVAHREEILKQAAVSFRNVRHSEDYGFFYGKQKTVDKSVIFASVSTLGREEYLSEDYFAPEYFDYIVIDEFHHAVNEQYQRIVQYFKPQFLLGLTATPERMDGKNIYEICDYNVPYEISLKEAINKGMLVPFHYYGIYDETDYSGLHLVKGRYDEKELNETYIGNVRRYDLIYKYYMKYRSKRALGFCCSRQHAEEMAREFCSRGIPSVAVYSDANGEFSEERERAIERLKNQEIRVIFSVDMFNEGVDIASLDMVMFLRPTESPIVFMQQLGRGLRTYRGKEYLNVLDFIGNYQKAGLAPMLLSGGKSSDEKRAYEYNEMEYPDDCIVDFDMRLVDIFKELDKKSVSIKERIVKEYYRVKDLLGNRVPTRMELFTYMEDEVYQYCMKHAKENPFRRYMDFLNNLHELSEEEERLYSGIGREFISMIETTDMQKVYKMPILYSFYNDGNIKMAVTEEDVLKSWKSFFDTGTNWKDFADNISYEDYKKMTDKQHLSKAKSMPIKYLKASGKGFFIEKEGYALALREDLKDIVQMDALRNQMKDILEYRTMEYYRRRYLERS
ncbi:DEAD/DEAH box helicase family protein [Roseburia sp. 499]|uniref:DEAD/DEAH box helicase family protein n=1 Tax=Roseburia sp. 499 TaxID=1261634 RepID=UPI000951071B|nr:DEAD/DEAH box helicase family protein [Roseburia sp. 499]WVK70217.1 DEAD/DEAH box helicase family protein [Roseburia sp. 499]